MPATRSLHLVNFTEAQIAEQHETYPHLSVSSKPMSVPDYLLVADVTVIIVKTDLDAMRILPTLYAAVEDITELGTPEVYSRNEPCVLTYITPYLRNLFDTPAYADQTNGVYQVRQWISWYQEALLETDGTDLTKTIGKLMDGGRDYLRSLLTEQTEAATGTGR